jgi:thiosulfate/3-mercaptopyruvate sulfurtransferase
MTSEADKAYKHGELLAETDWLAENLNEPNIRIVDMRGYVNLKEVAPGVQEADYTGARAEYEQGHLPGAIYLDWTNDIIDPTDPVPVQVASPDRLAAQLGELGIGNEHTIVIYDNHPAFQFATRLWWVLGYYGHDRVKILNGGLAKWQREGRPLTKEVPKFAPAVFETQIRPDWRISADELNARLGQSDLQLVDARDEKQYRGALRRGERGGRIPGAVHLPRELLVDTATGSFRTAAELERMAQDLGLAADEQVIAYCNGGVAATAVLFALRLVGYDRMEQPS